MKTDLEIPLGKRRKLYRFFEILPGFLSYTTVVLLFAVSLISPMLGAIYVLVIITTTLVKAVGVAFRTVQGYKIVRKAMAVNWAERLTDLKNPEESLVKMQKKKKEEYEALRHVENLKLLSKGGDFPKVEEIYHAVIMVAYNEGLETLVPSVEAVAKTSFDNEKIIFVLGYEARGGEEMRKNAKALKAKFEGVFCDFILVEHPDGLEGEIKGKGPNLTYAGLVLDKYIEDKKIDKNKVIVTSLDSDNRMSKYYLDNVAYEFVVRKNRQKLSYQPVSLFMNNIWDAAPPMRVIAVSNSFFNVISSMRPHALRNFASHSQPLGALSGMDFWSKRTIVEDGHQFWRSLFFFKGDYEVVSIKMPIYQDAVVEETLWKTLKAQFVQLRRWDYGASDVAYVGVRLFSKRREVPFWNLFPKFMRLLDGHVTLAVMAPIVAFGGWVPKLMNYDSRQLLTHNLPNTVSIIQMVASIGLMITILISLKMLPPRPEKYKKMRTVMMVLQWLLMPIIAIMYQSFAAFYAQTRLMTGRYMEKFDVTRKVVKK